MLLIKLQLLLGFQLIGCLLLSALQMSLLSRLELLMGRALLSLVLKLVPDLLFLLLLGFEL